MSCHNDKPIQCGYRKEIITLANFSPGTTKTISSISLTGHQCTASTEANNWIMDWSQPSRLLGRPFKSHTQSKQAVTSYLGLTNQPQALIVMDNWPPSACKGVILTWQTARTELAWIIKHFPPCSHQDESHSVCFRCSVIMNVNLVILGWIFCVLTLPLLFFK